MDEDQDPVCLGCHRSIEEGSVVAFGEGLWHVQWQVGLPFRFRLCSTARPFINGPSYLPLLATFVPLVFAVQNARTGSNATVISSCCPMGVQSASSVRTIVTHVDCPFWTKLS